MFPVWRRSYTLSCSSRASHVIHLGAATNSWNKLPQSPTTYTATEGGRASRCKRRPAIRSTAYKLLLLIPTIPGIVVVVVADDSISQYFWFWKPTEFVFFGKYIVKMWVWSCFSIWLIEMPKRLRPAWGLGPNQELTLSPALSLCCILFMKYEFKYEIFIALCKTVCVSAATQ